MRRKSEMKSYGFILSLLLSMQVWAGNGQSKTFSREEELVQALRQKNNSVVDKMLDEEAESNWQVKRKASVLHWAVRAVCAGGERAMLDTLLALDEYKSLAGKCSDALLANLCHAASKVRKFQPDRYRILCNVIEVLANRPGVLL